MTRLIPETTFTTDSCPKLQYYVPLQWYKKANLELSVEPSATNVDLYAPTVASMPIDHSPVKSTYVTIVVTTLDIPIA